MLSPCCEGDILLFAAEWDAAAQKNTASRKPGIELSDHMEGETLREKSAC